MSFFAKPGTRFCGTCSGQTGARFDDIRGFSRRAARFPDMPGRRRRQDFNRRRRHPLSRRTTSCSLCSTRHRRRRRVHAVEMPVGSGRLVPRQSQEPDGPRARRQFRQRQCLYRQERPPTRRNSPPRSPPRPPAARRARCTWRRPASSASRSRRAAFRRRHGGLAAGAQAGSWNEAARAIMTTDTFPKGAAATAKLGEATVTICGIAKAPA